MGITLPVDLPKVLKDTSNLLKAKYLLTSDGRNRVLMGDSREDIVKSFLHDYLPRNLAFERGEVFNTNGAVSNQVDIIIHDPAVPVFKTPQLSLFPIESVVATCEVKTTLDRERLNQAVENVQSVKRLVKKSDSRPTMPPYGIVFAFEGSAETIRENLMVTYKERSVTPDEQVNLVCVLDQFIGIGYPGSLGLGFGKEYGRIAEEPIVFMNTGEDSLLIFLSILIGALRIRPSASFSLWSYIQPKGYSLF
jgi:hypothetical protein